MRAVRDGELIERAGPRDKEFHFQNWFRARLVQIGEPFDEPGRNRYPDFRMVRHAEGYELKGLAYPGREATFDCNSQIPYGEHNGRQVFYLFGRYPRSPAEERYPVLDLVMCHGSFLNANDAYEHRNMGFHGFGSYGDILVRNRKMYVAPTPFALIEGTAHRRTLIVPASMEVDPDLVETGTLVRKETERLVVAFSFDLRTNEMTTTRVPNPASGKTHLFRAYRVAGDPVEPVALRGISPE